MHRVYRKIFISIGLALFTLHPATAEPRKDFKVAWSIYVPNMPWGWAQDNGIVKKWADKFGITITSTKFTDYVESINQYTSGQYDALLVTSMDTIVTPAVGGVDNTVVVVQDYSNGNDAVFLKRKGKKLEDIKGQRVNLIQYKDRLATQITREHGKVFSDARGEVERGIDIVEFACGIPHLLQGGFSDQVSRGLDNWTLRQPLGVVAGITPFNFPVMVPAWMWPLAIAAGNTFVLKPSPIDPSASLMIADMLKEAGLPAGVQATNRSSEGQPRNRQAEAINHPDLLC